METEEIEISDELFWAFGDTKEEATRNIQARLSVAIYRRGDWDFERAAKESGFGRDEFAELVIRSKAEIREPGIAAEYSELEAPQ